MFAKRKVSQSVSGMTESRRKLLGKVSLVDSFTVALFLFTQAVVVQARTNTPAKDPGPRTGAAGAGGMISGLTANQQAFFTAGLANFVEVDSVTGSVSNTGNGLGPRFNAESC